MTCGLAVKRPHDYESYLSPDASVEVKRSRTANTHCSPFRPQLGTLATSLMQSTSASAFPKENSQVYLYLLIQIFLKIFITFFCTV